MRSKPAPKAGKPTSTPMRDRMYANSGTTPPKPFGKKPKR